MSKMENLPAITEFVFEKTFQCRTAFDERTETVYVCLSDLLKAQNTTTNTSKIFPEIEEIFEKGWKIVLPLSTPGGTQNTIFISRDAAVFVVSRGRTKQGKRFNRWLFSEVLPQIWKTGRYSLKSPNTSPHPPLIDRVYPINLSDRAVEWVFTQVDPMHERDMMRGTGVSHSYARTIFRDLQRKGIISRHRDGYCRLTAKALSIMRDREEPERRYEYFNWYPEDRPVRIAKRFNTNSLIKSSRGLQ